MCSIGYKNKKGIDKMNQLEESPSDRLQRLLNEKVQKEFEDLLWNEALRFMGAGLIALIIIAIFV